MCPCNGYPYSNQTGYVPDIAPRVLDVALTLTYLVLTSSNTGLECRWFTFKPEVVVFDIYLIFF